MTALSINRLVDFGGGRITQGQIVLTRDSGPTDLAEAGEATLRRVRGREIGMIFQEPMTSLNPVHTIGRQIAEVFRPHRGLDGAAAQRAAEALEREGVCRTRRRARLLSAPVSRAACASG